MWEEREKAADGWRKGDAVATARLKELDAILIPKVKLIGDGCQQKYLKGYGFASPVSDGARVYIKNVTGMLAAVDLDGNVQWAHDIGYNGGHSSVASLCLVDGHLIVWNAVNNSAQHTLASYDAKTGELSWKTEPRPAGPGAGCASPVVLRLKDVPVILAANGDVVRAADGKILAKEIHPQGFSTPPYHDDVVFFGVNGGNESVGAIEAVRLTLDGDKVTGTKLWSAKPQVKDGANDGSMYGAQVYYDGYLYTYLSRGQLSAIDADTGEVKYAWHAHPGKGGEVYSNLSVAGGKVYGFDLNGRGIVVKPGPAGDVIARNDCMGGATGSPFFATNRIYLRNNFRKWMPTWIYCLEEDKPAGDGGNAK